MEKTKFWYILTAIWFFALGMLSGALSPSISAALSPGKPIRLAPLRPGIPIQLKAKYLRILERLCDRWRFH